MIQRQTD